MTQIPKKIHYCWFGRNPLPESAQKCIASWRKYLPDYEIIEWNEDNFDVNSIPYTAQAYAAKKYAFVSDYARFKILYEYGGVYFDTDVEVIMPMNDIIDNGAFMGRELTAQNGGSVAPGLGLAVCAKHPIYRELLNKYSNIQFTNADGSLNFKTIVEYTTELLSKKGLRTIDTIQTIDGITIYPKEYFNPLDDNTGILKITSNTHSIHWYSKTWLSVPTWRIKLSRQTHRIFGVDTIHTIHKFVNKLFCKL